MAPSFLILLFLSEAQIFFFFEKLFFFSFTHCVPFIQYFIKLQPKACGLEILTFGGISEGKNLGRKKELFFIFFFLFTPFKKIVIKKFFEFLPFRNIKKNLFYLVMSHVRKKILFFLKVRVKYKYGERKRKTSILSKRCSCPLVTPRTMPILIFPFTSKRCLHFILFYFFLSLFYIALPFFLSQQRLYERRKKRVFFVLFL